jgi:hypothetical protein
MFVNFWSILDDLNNGTVVGGLKVISRSFKVIFDDFPSFIYTYMGLQM